MKKRSEVLKDVLFGLILPVGWIAMFYFMAQVQ